MRILLLGSGGREHALAWKIRQSELTEALYIAPGNPGTAKCGTNVELNTSDFSVIGKFCSSKKIDMVIVGPKEPLVNGLYDFFKSKDSLKHIHFIGPSKAGARLEGSKAFAKEFMYRYQIPTAAYREFTIDNYEEGVHYLEQHSLPIVLKADGLAGGKGVVICQHHVEAIAEFEPNLDAFVAEADVETHERPVAGVESQAEADITLEIIEVDQASAREHLARVREDRHIKAAEDLITVLGV